MLGKLAYRNAKEVSKIIDLSDYNNTFFFFNTCV